MARTPCPHNRGSAEPQAAASLRSEDEAALPKEPGPLLEQESAGNDAPRTERSLHLLHLLLPDPAA